MALLSIKVSAAASVQGQPQPGSVQVKSARVSVAQTTGLVLIAGGGFTGPSASFTNLGSVGATVTLDVHNNRLAAFTLTLSSAACAISVINAQPGSQIDIYPFQDASPPRAITHPASVVWTGTGAPILSTSQGGVDRFSYLVTAVDGSGNPTQMIGSLGAVAGAPPAPVTPPVVT